MTDWSEKTRIVMTCNRGCAGALAKEGVAVFMIEKESKPSPEETNPPNEK